MIEVVAKTREDRIDLTRYMARDLLGITLDEEQSLPLREYDLSMLLRPFDFPTDPADGIAGVTVKELRVMDQGQEHGPGHGPQKNARIICKSSNTGMSVSVIAGFGPWSQLAHPPWTDGLDFHPGHTASTATISTTSSDTAGATGSTHIWARHQDWRSRRSPCPRSDPDCIPGVQSQSLLV